MEIESISLKNTESNKIHFDSDATRYDDRPGAAKVARVIANAILKEYAFDDESTVIMEYACGTGIVSRELCPVVKQIVGVDISQAMVDHYNARVAYQGIPPDEMRAICCELKGEEGELENGRFDVILCSMAYHHFPDINAITQILAFFLKEGGVLFVVDLIKDTDEDEQAEAKEQRTCHGQIVAHKGGIREAQIQTAFEYANLVEYAYRPCAKIKSKNKETRLFLARGTKLAETR